MQKPCHHFASKHEAKENHRPRRGCQAVLKEGILHPSLRSTKPHCTQTWCYKLPLVHLALSQAEARGVFQGRKPSSNFALSSLNGCRGFFPAFQGRKRWKHRSSPSSPKMAICALPSLCRSTPYAEKSHSKLFSSCRIPLQ